MFSLSPGVSQIKREGFLFNVVLIIQWGLQVILLSTFNNARYKLSSTLIKPFSSPIKRGFLPCCVKWQHATLQQLKNFRL
jgi:hypothetical protein